MATVAPDQNPQVLDTVLFNLPTPDANGCFLADPYMVNSVVVYFVERDFADLNENQYDNIIQDDAASAAADAAEAVACANPTAANIQQAKTLRSQANSLAFTSPFYYNDANPVTVVGNADYPAWLTTDQSNAFITHTGTGQFQYAWNSYGMREGDYFVCWTWTPNPAGDTISNSFKFNLAGNSVVTTSIPTHYTQPDKYYTLLTTYLPETYKTLITDTDRTPDVLDRFNQAVALGFTAVENLANQIVDLQDANSTAEAFLPLLARYFGITLKTQDPALWRRQIKQAIPLFKKKGTIGGLQEALAQAGIRMAKVTRLWQIISSYTWQDAFTYDGTNDTWELSKTPVMPIDPTNYAVYLRPEGQPSYMQLGTDYVSFGTDMDGNPTVTWAGSGLMIDPIDLVAGDIVKVLYVYKSVPDSPHQTIENYVRSLPLADQRDETKQQYPLKNWNVRLIEEDDPLFNVVIPDKFPFMDPLIYGKVRTEFPYSENAYNADEYNGSIRNSYNPCDIDKDFLDPCTACLGSKFNIDLEIENLSNNRILEAQDVILEFVPFHAQLQTMNFTGGITEFITPPLEEIEVLVSVSGGDFVLCGEGQMWFNRAMKGGLTTHIIDRSMLASSDIPISNQAGTAYNDYITIWSSSVLFDNIAMSTDGSALLEVFAPSPNAGTYNLSNPSRNTAVVTGATEPLNTSAFTFRLSNVLTSGTLCNIYQNNSVTLLDANNPFPSVLSLFDVTYNGATGPYTVLIPAYSATHYQVNSVFPDGSLELLDHGETLPTSNVTNVAYTLYDENGAVVSSSTTGGLTIAVRGRVQSLDSSIQDIHNMIRGTCYVVTGGSQYLIDGFVSPTDDAEFYIDGYAGGDMAGTTLTIYQRIVDNEIGYFSHRGLELQVSGNLETTLNIQNGANPPATPLENNDFMENYIVTINSQDYLISMINGNSPPGYTTITLAGPDNYWKTLGAGGTSVNFTVTHFTKETITVPGQQFDLPAHTFPTYDRGGREVIDQQTNNDPPVGVSMVGKGAGLTEVVEQSEGISFEIEWADGSKDQGNI
jgi:hypothetical protein